MKNSHKKYWATVLAAIAMAAISTSMISKRSIADCGFGPGTDTPDYDPTPGCWIPWATCACTAAGQADGVACDDGSMCMHEVITNPKVDYYDPAPTGRTYPSLSTVESWCRLVEVECNPFGSPPCVETGDRIMEAVYEADFSLTDPCP
jgi:hypothetical protein